MFTVFAEKLAIPGVLIVNFGRFRDERGYFSEPYRRSDLLKLAELEEFVNLQIVQTNESLSRPRTIRGLHFQYNPFMGKLVRSLRGEFFDLIVDIRKNSPVFGHGLIVKLTYDASLAFDRWLWLPPGMAHGLFCFEEVLLEYLCSGEYNQNGEVNISPLAKDIDWSAAPREFKELFDSLINSKFLISEKDKSGLTIEAWREDSRSENFNFDLLA